MCARTPRRLGTALFRLFYVRPSNTLLADLIHAMRNEALALSCGSGVTASPEQAQETHKAIRDWIAKEVSPSVAAGIRIQYGGSANAKNAPDLSAQPDIDGFLVGGASLKPEFAEIVSAIAKAK